MCGIAGIIGQSTLIHLNKMNAAQAHRGPDAEGTYANESNTIFLGHQRLSIIDLSNTANQPMHSHCNRFVMVFNGEVFNYQSIANKLNRNWKTHSDSEVILEAFVEWGEEFVQELNGMFAIVIYDKQKNVSYFFRDRLGVKPLYYGIIDNILYFASELKSLKAVIPTAALKINQQAIIDFLQLGYIPKPHTIYTEIYKFPPGAKGFYNGTDLAVNYYWKAEDQIKPVSNYQNNFTEAKKALDSLIEDSVRLRMIADVPFGTFLSGGIDSSLITAMAQKNTSTPINSFSIAMRDAKFNEIKYASAVAKHLHTNHHIFEVNEVDVLEHLHQMTDAFDEPFADSSALPTLLVSRLAKSQVTMTLSGDGGDELFQGYGMYTWAQRLNNPLTQAFKPLIVKTLKQLSNKYQRGADVFNYTAKERIPSHIFSQEQYLFSEHELKSLLINSTSTITSVRNYFDIQRNLNAAEKQALFDLKYYLPDDLLVKVDRASMQYALETRTPFLDYRVVEFALNLPYDMKVKGNVSKYILKEVLYDYVPKSIFDRPKWGFSIPLIKWLNTELKSSIENVLSRSNIEAVGLVKFEEVDRLLKAYQNDKSHLYNRIWALYILHTWFINEAKNKV